MRTKNAMQLPLAFVCTHIEEGLYDEGFLLSKTSAAYLVNTATGAYARAAELIEGAGEIDQPGGEWPNLYLNARCISVHCGWL